MRNICWMILCVIVFKAEAQTKLSLNTDSTGITISPSLYGIFFEDINHAADGGIYAELISNRSFEDNSAAPSNWTLVQKNGSAGSVSLDTAQKLNTSQTYELKLNATNASPTSVIGVTNSGFWGINISNGQTYTLSFFARANDGFKGKVIVSLENSSGTVTYATKTVSGISAQWNKYSVNLLAAGGAPQGRFSLYIDSIGSIWLDEVSLFPQTFKNRENGLRPDLANMIADLKPRFMRFPGGCFVEGDYLINRFQWKNTIGKIETRKGHYNLWGYRTSNGLGFHEFLQMAEDIGAVPLYVTNIGIAHNNIVSYLSINEYVQDVLDAIEYANGDINTTYGAMRAANGHPEPFNLKYIEIGNENNQFNDSRSDHYAERYQAFYTAIKAKYPNILCIGNVEAWGTDNPSWKINQPVDFVDEHYYRDPQWFISNANKYDTYSRSGPKVYVGEYAVTSNCGNGNLWAAIGEAAFMTGIERNSDIVAMCSYAPVFVNDNNRAWNPDLINFNSSKSYGTPSYYVQKMFAGNIGDVLIPVREQANIQAPKPINGSFGLGTWATQVQYDSVIVSGKITSFTDMFNSSANWNALSGTWTASNGFYSQTSTATDCRSIAKFTISDTSYTYTLKALKTGGNEGFLIIFGYQDSNNFYWWNIGGWNNTKHAIEKCVNGTKSTVASVNGSIQSNKWYLLKIEVKKDTVKCYMDNNLIHKFINPSSKLLYISATKNTATKEVFLKVVNTASQTVNTTIAMSNQSKDTRIAGSVTVLTSSSLTNENSFTNPTAISPVTTSITDSSVFNYSFPANSVTIFNVLQSGGTDVIKKASTIMDKGMKIYPNPLESGSFKIELPEEFRNKNSKLFLYSMDGKVVFSQILNNRGIKNIELKNIQPGTYIVSVIGNQQVLNQKIIKL